MSKGKHSNVTASSSSSKRKSNTFLKVLLAFFVVLFLVLLISTLLYFFLTQEKANHNSQDNYTSSQIDVKKYVIGLESVEVLRMNIKSSEEFSMIEISLKNTEDTKLDSCKIHLYLLDETGSVLFGSSIHLPELEADSQTTFSVACSDNIDNVVDYKIVLE